MAPSVDGLPSCSLNIKEYRTIWISDFHLGTPRCKANALRDFLRNHRAETLFLVGDILDGWSMGPGWCWTPEQTAVVEEIWSWRRHGSRIIFLPGNHDENDSELVRMLFGQIEIVPHLLHRTAENRRMLVIHGHQFDSRLHGSRWMSMMGSIGYTSALRLNVWYNRNGLAKPNLCPGDCRPGGLRQRIKRAIHQLVDFPDTRVTETVRRHRADGVICGHTHHPERRMIGPLLYVNDGDWVQSRTALVEETGGALSLLHWPDAPLEIGVERSG